METEMSVEQLQQRFVEIRKVAERLGCPKSVFNAQTWELVKVLPKEHHTPGIWLSAAVEVVAVYILNTSHLKTDWFKHEEWVSVQVEGEIELVDVWLQAQYQLFPEETYRTSHRILYLEDPFCKMEVTSLQRPIFKGAA